MKDLIDIVNEGLNPLPNVIDDKWLKEQLNNDMFSCWGLATYDLSKVKFDIKDKNLLNQIIFNYKDRDMIPFDNQDDNYFQSGNGIERLHEKGINGNNVNVAVIDYGFQKLHNDLKDVIKEYIELKNENYVPKNEFHGIVVSGFLCGKKTGVAPKANLYFFEDTHNPQYGYPENLKKIYEMNLNGANIQVVNLSSGYFDDTKEINEYKELLKNQGCIVLDAHVFENDFLVIKHDLNTNEYTLSEWQKKIYKDQIMVPTTGGATLSAFKDDEYIIDKSDDFSWYIPVVSGIMTLCKQINKDITYEEFIKIARLTANKINGYSVISPAKIIDYINKNN